MNRDNNQNARPFAMFMCSLIPGCAHMYLGLVKRGVQMLMAFTLSIGIASTFHILSFVLVPLTIVIYVYSFFDGYSVYRNLKAGKVVEDESIIEGLEPLRKLLSNGYWIGLVLLILGAFSIFQNVIRLDIINDSVHRFIREVDNFIPAVLLLGFGIFLMLKGNKQRKVNKEELQRPTE